MPAAAAISSIDAALPGQQTISITFGDRAENHVGMQLIGELAESGFSLADLKGAKAKLEARGCSCTLVPLHPNLPVEGHDGMGAWVLVAKDAVTSMLSMVAPAASPNPPTADGLFAEHLAVNCDKKAKMRGRVVNKHARWNVCFGAANQEPDYEAGRGRVVAFADVPLLQGIREEVLPALLGNKAMLLQGELNHYYDNRRCGIGFHGDSERKMVACLRLGAATPLHFQWFHEGLPVGERVELTLRHGDFYVMSEKATGFDWKKRKTPTLRHAAGAAKFLKIAPRGPR